MNPRVGLQRFSPDGEHRSSVTLPLRSPTSAAYEWNWLADASPFSRGFFISVGLIGLVCVGGLMLFNGLLMLRSRSARFELAGAEVALRDGRAVALGGILTAVGVGLLGLATTMLL